MLSRPLIIDEHSSAEIERVCAWADAHRLSLRDVVRRTGGGLGAIGDDPHFACVVPFGYRCVLSIEQQQAGWCRHLSVSVLGPEEAPSVPVVEALLREFGFRCELSPLALHPPLHVDKEDIGPNKIAVSVWELLEP